MGNYTREEMEMRKNARAFAEANQEKIEAAAKYTINAVGSVKEEVKHIASMKTDRLEEYLKDNAQSLWENIKEKITASRDRLSKLKVDFPELEEREGKLTNILNTFSEILDDDELNGWGKFKEIVRELTIWVVRMFIIACKPTLLSVLGGITLAILTPVIAVAYPVYDTVKTSMENAEKSALQERRNNYSETNIQIKRTYRNHCWNCHTGVTEENVQCPICGWYICPTCGSCKRGCTRISSISTETARYESDYQSSNKNYNQSNAYNNTSEKYGYDDEAIESSPEYWEDIYDKCQWESID
ncbi:hypothetical protein [Konateibacter massiliensis]|uniref:hypothetical protein n=1 Tax=Konateibacter massiliensis TaxID=2002841 RepID=UPI000C15292E|nr:hypothetical protein [Konateibacter massiliensis]